MSGIYLGRTALALLIPAVVVFGLFMFGAGFLSGNFYKARTTPVETVIRRDATSGSTLSNLQAQEAEEAQTPDEAESLAQATGRLEEAEGQAQTAAQPETPPEGASEAPPETPVETQQEATAQAPPETAPQPDASARDRALAELRASQQDGAASGQPAPDTPETPAEPTAETPAPAETTQQPSAQQPYTFQVGAFLVEPNAAELAATLVSRGYEAWVVSEKGSEGRLWHFVRVGRYQDHEEATSAAAAFRQREGVNAVPVPLSGQQATANGMQLPAGEPVYVVHAGAFSNAQAARNAARPLLDLGYVPCVATILDEQHQTWHLVEVVEFPTRAEAEAFMQQNAQRGGGPELRIRELDARAISGKHCF